VKPQAHKVEVSYGYEKDFGWSKPAEEHCEIEESWGQKEEQDWGQKSWGQEEQGWGQNAW